MGTTDWGHLRSGLAGGLIAALLISTPAVSAAVGGIMRIGQVNKGNAATTLQGASDATLSLVNTRAAEVALNLRVKSGPALRVNTMRRIPKLNADRVDGMHASELAVPSGAVMFFDAATCPAGWTVYKRARGRTIVGVPAGGTLEGISGTPLTNQQNVTTTGGTHNHIWAYYDRSYKVWKTYSAGGSPELLAEWGDGMDQTGSGYYPLAPHSTHNTGTGYVEYYTAMGGGHAHTVDMPYVQLLACKKG